MSDFDDNLEFPDDLFDIDFSEVPITNKRVATRYIREDIAASVCKISWFNFGFRFNKDIFVELVDISSKGVLIATSQNLPLNKKITLTLTFEDLKSFIIQAKVVRKALADQTQYGIKFDRTNDDLGDYLLETQRKLVFK
ncbi:MAG: PilZ domain-containing protein [Methylococcaceae bacterium]|nr:PilZ domain-containing protein [Methylococcaceae bacterium]MDZ4158006.1 PilZ domain-containing protein [Methylococcales bacterium]MDP2392797.1 PilZ domain-containing protein [Methylococcaceae bacterium]MDP3020325.1 PilZ domain-containing protein [Methylococcaceae bacterium]MDP3391932.1 PilZ domain-containing protein [Methylococcaceae bacterium]